MGEPVAFTVLVYVDADDFPDGVTDDEARMDLVTRSLTVDPTELPLWVEEIHPDNLLAETT